ncbi:hypothetical protein [Dyadobacter sp. NIV53]|uniref:hypothetical protein n=1 Tax=Dyadobacter sp. NIV53 TaxID=2861765 RepID=UPI001C874E16|nr:hypothetical protein [Dyadobacter sp. NIV53]
MKESDDDEIQKMLEKDLNPESQFESDPEDLKIYSRLFKELNKEPEVKLSYSFSANVIRKIKYKQQRRSDIRLAILVAGLIITGLVVFTNSSYFKDALPAISGGKWLVFAGLLFLTVIQFLDQKLIIERRLPK